MEKKELKCTCVEHDPYCCQIHGICPTCVKKEEPKQETLEEAAEKYAKYNLDSSHLDIDDHFIDGAKWQAERMYNEEDLRQAYKDGMSSVDCREDVGLFCIQKEEEWFEQFKKR